MLLVVSVYPKKIFMNMLQKKLLTPGKRVLFKNNATTNIIQKSKSHRSFSAFACAKRFTEYRQANSITNFLNHMIQLGNSAGFLGTIVTNHRTLY